MDTEVMFSSNVRQSHVSLNGHRNFCIRQVYTEVWFKSTPKSVSAGNDTDTDIPMMRLKHNKTKKVWECVPLQDFTQNSDIDWSESIPEIDQQLYKKYNLSEEEISFIEREVQPMT